MFWTIINDHHQTKSINMLLLKFLAGLSSNISHRLNFGNNAAKGVIFVISSNVHVGQKPGPHAFHCLHDKLYDIQHFSDIHDVTPHTPQVSLTFLKYHKFGFFG